MRLIPGEWMLFETSSPFAGNQTGLSFGMLYDRSGRLIAKTLPAKPGSRV